MQHPSQTHRVVLVVEVDEPTDLSSADLVAMADVLREAAVELAPQGTTRASVELGVAAEADGTGPSADGAISAGASADGATTATRQPAGHHPGTRRSLRGVATPVRTA